MRIVSLLGGLVKGKLLVTVLVSLALVGGTTAVMAATPGGQSVFHAVTGTSTSTAKVAVTVATKQVSVCNQKQRGCNIPSEAGPSWRVFPHSAQHAGAR